MTNNFTGKPFTPIPIGCVFPESEEEMQNGKGKEDEMEE